MTNFGFLRVEWPDLFEEAVRAERIAIVDPRASCFYARRCLELSLNWLFDADDTLRPPYKDDLAARLAEPTLVNLVGPGIRTKMDLIRRVGNQAVHRVQAVEPHVSLRVVAELFHVMYWIARRYTRSEEDPPADGLAFNQALIPKPLSAEARALKQAELKAQAEVFAKQQEELAKAKRKAEDLDAEILRLREEIKKAKAANAVRPDTHDYNEKQTRTLIIDLLLREAGWKLDRAEDREFPVTGLPTSVVPSGTGKVDYVLWDDNGKPLGLVEAKRTTHDVTKGQHQAKLYADALEGMYGQRPVIFYTNGYQTQIWDDTFYPPREIQGFYTKDELRSLINRRAGRQRPSTTPINEEIAGRSYQARAIRQIGETLEAKQRQALLVMATGSGKTRTVIALVDVLIKAGWVKRVLFLADRQALVKQAANAFKAHLPGVPAVNLLEDKAQTARVYVSTYPTMMGLVNGVSADQRKFGPGFFDLVIVDEAHRSIYQKYKALFDYFDGLLVGLTATPRDEIDRNTYRMFGLEDGVPTDVYELDEAVADGYLVPPKTVDVPLKFIREGIKYDDLSEEDKDAWDVAEWDDDGQVPDFVPPEEVNKYLFNADTIDKALHTLMTHGLKVAGGEQLGKTIIFAQNNKHAEFIAERFNKIYPEHQGDFAQVITHAKDYAQDLIDKFSDKDRAPHIAISVDMLDTGIDVPEVVNLVFAKMVRSKTKFWQMIGRGTRLCPNLFGPDQNKLGFLVFDLCRNVEFFNSSIAKAEPRLQPSLSEKIFRHRADLLLALDHAQRDLAPPVEGAPDGTQSEEGLRWDLATRLQIEVAGMNPENIEVRPHRERVEKYGDPTTWRQVVTQEQHAEVTDHLAGLPTAFREDENSEEAKRFDLLTLRLQLAVINAEPGFDRLRDQVQEIASALLDQAATNPAVGAHQVLLDELTTDEWWQDVRLPMLETMRRRIRPLVKLIEKIKRGVVYTDFEDQLGELTLPELKGIPIGTNKSRFEAKVRNYLRLHENELAVQKLRRNRQITASDLSALEKIFTEAGYGTEADVEQAATEYEGFGLFLRSLTGLDRAAAAAAFDEFQAGKVMSPRELDFLKMLIDHLAKNGTIDVGHLYEPPFTALAPGGPEAVFGDQGVDAIVAALHQVRATAIPIEAQAG